MSNVYCWNQTTLKLEYSWFRYSLTYLVLWSSLFRVAELRPAHLTELFLYFSPTFLYLPRPVMTVLNPSCLDPKLSIARTLQRVLAAYRNRNWWACKQNQVVLRECNFRCHSPTAPSPSTTLVTLQSSQNANQQLVKRRGCLRVIICFCYHVVRSAANSRIVWFVHKISGGQN